jgi:SpoVK/Ycf46/Vps4 family AAA+-type ATPase
LEKKIMAKKKKKSRASTGSSDVKKTIFPDEKESPRPPLVNYASLRVIPSTSTPSKSMKYTPTIILNELDADSLDVLYGDEVFLISGSDSSMLGEGEDVHAAIAKVHVNTNSQGVSPSKTHLSMKQRVKKLTSGHCHVYPTSLANSILGKEKETRSIPETLHPAAPEMSVAKNPQTAYTLSSPKSEFSFSFSKTGGGDVLIKSPSDQLSTPTSKQQNTPRPGARSVWVVPRESDLGVHISGLLCRRASCITIEEVGGDSTKLKKCNGPLGGKLVLAQTVGSYVMGTDTSFRLSFQGQYIDCVITDVQGIPTVEGISHGLAKLSIETTDESDEPNPVLELLHSLGEEKIKHLQLYLITQQTTVILDKEKSEEGTKEKEKPKSLVAGLDSTLDEVKTMLSTPLLHPELFSDSLRPPKGVLLHGPSGTGKSSLALQLAQSLPSEIHVEHINCTMLQSYTALVGQAESRLVQLFETAQRPRQGKSGSLVILDDVHLICPRREGVNLGADRLSATLLALLDGIGSTSSSYPFMILAITTNPSLLDPALRRPGRLDSEVEIPLPDEPSTRSEILQFHCDSLGAISNFSDTEWLALARIAKGFTGADLKLAVKEACRTTALRDTGSIDVANIDISRDDLERAIRATKPSAIKAVTVEIPQVYWSSIGGMDSVKRELREAIELPMTHGHMFQKLGIRPPRGVLLYGPPGCSKTLMARALATEGEMNFLAVKGPELLSKWLGESERALASLFKRARLASPCVIFFDEVDAIASKRSGNSSGGERLLSQLLTELDGIHSKEDAAKKRRVIIVCATNRPDLLDDALMRPGRIDRMIHVGVPDEASRNRILEISLRGKSCADDIDVSTSFIRFSNRSEKVKLTIFVLS